MAEVDSCKLGYGEPESTKIFCTHWLGNIGSGVDGRHSRSRYYASISQILIALLRCTCRGVLMMESRKEIEGTEQHKVLWCSM